MEAPAIRVVFFDLGDTLVTTADRRWVPGAVELLETMRGLSLRLGVISNTGDLSRDGLSPFLPPDFKWGRFEVDLVLLSSEVDVEKPSLEIFRLAVARSGVAPGACLFCTDTLDEALAAQRAGMVAARVKAPPASELGSLIGDLKRGGLLPPGS